MKLRIRDNSVRLRLTRSEVARLHQDRFVESRTCFGLQPEQVFSYRIEVSETARQLAAHFLNSAIVVVVPKTQGEAWCTTDQVALQGKQELKGSQNSLSILIEKDFFCLKPRQNEIEDESDMYSHPNAGTGVC